MKKISPRNLFWNKWSHAVQVRNPALRFHFVRDKIRNNNLIFSEDQIKTVEDPVRHVGPGYRVRSYAMTNYDIIEFRNFITALSKYVHQNGKIEKFRFETQFCTMYTNDCKLFDLLNKYVSSSIYSLAAPVNQSHEDMLRNSNNSSTNRFKEKIVKQLPKNGFLYKVNLINIGALLNKFPNMGGVLLDYQREGLCEIPRRCINALTNRDRYIYYTHIYVKDEDTLNMLMLMIDSSYLSEIEVFKTYQKSP